MSPIPRTERNDICQVPSSVLYEVDLQQVQIHLPTLVLPFLTRCCEGQEYIAWANEPRMKIGWWVVKEDKLRMFVFRRTKDRG